VLILASASPRRRELLAAAGIPHLVRQASVSEIREPGETAEDFVRRLAETKARAIPRASSEIVLGADTVVCVDNEVLGKPCDMDDAVRMLRLLSGREHLVHTGICLLGEQSCIIDLATTRVSFVRLTEDEISSYTRSGEPTDKAGAYAIQGLASKFVFAIEGSYSNVVGLPVALVYRHWKALVA
jgi:septum formation protein